MGSPRLDAAPGQSPPGPRRRETARIAEWSSSPARIPTGAPAGCLARHSAKQVLRVGPDHPSGHRRLDEPGGVDAGDADGGVGDPVAPGPPEGVRDHHADAHREPAGQAVPDAPCGAVRVDREEGRLACSDVGEVHPGVRADEAVVGLGEEQLSPAAQDPAGLGLDQAAERVPVLGIDRHQATLGLRDDAAYRALHGLDFVALALANVYGPRQDPHGEAGVVAIFAGRLLDGEECVIFGDGSQTRDFVFVDDVVDAFVRAGERGGGMLLNVGTGIETSVNELFDAIAAAVAASTPGRDRAAAPVRARHAPPRPGELARSALSPARAAAELDWKPWTSLADGIAAVVEFERARRAEAGAS